MTNNERQAPGGSGQAGSNPVLEALLNRATVRRFTDQPVTDEVVETIVRAGQQAPFTGQMYSVIVVRDQARRQELTKFFGPLPAAGQVFMLLCLDLRKLEKFVAAKDRTNRANDMALMILGTQDVALFGMNLTLAADSLGLGSVFLGGAPFFAAEFAAMFKLPPRVFPIVGLVLGYAAERPKARPRIPTRYALHWEEYRDLSAADVTEALSVMDAGLLREGYYARLKAKIRLKSGARDQVTYDEYGWGEHVSRKYGQESEWSGLDLVGLLRERGIDLNRK
ncbi:MAG: nitroreductase family protein [Symbiobacteriia bacterium]